MKHPALTRVFSLALALLCLTMAAAGGLGLRRADKDRQRVLDDVARLRDRAASYREVTDLLSLDESYSALSEALEDKQSQHDEDSSEHRAELSTYTLTQYGIGMGTQAIDEADRQFVFYKTLFEQTIPPYEEALGQASSLIGSLREIYDAAMLLLGNANAHLASANAFAALLGAGEGLSYAELAAACGEIIAIADEIDAIPGQLAALLPALEALAAFDPESLTALSEGMDALPESLGAFGGLSLEGYAEAGSPVDFDVNALVQFKAVYDQLWPLVGEGLVTQETLTAQLNAAVQAATGMSTGEIRQAAQSTLDSIAALGDEEIDPLLEGAIYASYAANSASILAALDAANTSMAEINAEAEALGSALGTIESQLASFTALLAQAREMISQGASALYDARAMIWYQMGQQQEKEEQLRREKERLAEEAETLQTLSDEAEERKEAERRQRSLRAILLKREEIRARVDAGEEPDAAALGYAQERESDALTEHTLRFRACLLMLGGALCGLLCIPAAFEQIRSRFLLLVPVLLCLGCAAMAEWTLWQMGRGHSYSALSVALFALIQLFVSAPTKKKSGA